MTIIIVLLTIFLKIVITIRVPTSWTDQIKQQSTQQLKPYGSHERHQNLNLQQQEQNGWVPIQPPPHYYFANPPPTRKSTKFKKTHPLNQKHAAKFGINLYQENPPKREPDRRPDGYEVFEKNSRLFDGKRAEFDQNLENLPKRHKLGRFVGHQDDDDRDEDDVSTEFTPTRLYSQVRRFNDRQHLPSDQADDPRLREIIRDSRIHTVYTEEGYEDSGYDHGGHEKNAEEDAGYTEFEKELEQDNSGGLQISSEIKLVKSPKNNQTEMHKYVKIAPKSMDFTKRNKRTVNEKYPYYNRTGINPDSPLRYSENFVNIPDKQHDNLAFYHQADNRIKCGEVETDIDPVPERVENTNDGPVRDVGGEELRKMPRLRQLGDKIDCFKAKYFGENPLDNPLFDEVTIAPVRSIFDQLSIQTEAVKSTINDESLGAKILNDIVVQQQQQQRNGRDLEESPVSGALLGKQQRRRFKPKRPYLINRFPPFRRTITTTTTPSTISEVHYKNEIRPDEQFNVLHDVINNIRNSPKEAMVVSASNFAYLTTTKYPDLVDNIRYDNLELLKIGVTRSTKLPTTSTTERQQQEVDGEVVGLSPPTPIRYKTIYHKLDDNNNNNNNKTPINQFYVDGMKPPPIQHKFYLYKDFKKKINQRQRYRRTAQRSIYSQVVRNRNKPIDIDDNDDFVIVTTTTTDDDDDYVPHRPKNYHYDEKLGRIVYDKTTQSPVDDEGIEEILITEPPLPKPTRRTQVKFTSNPDEPSFLQFIKTLKSNSDYKQITEPPPSMIEQKTVITTTMSSVDSLPTRPAQFLGVLSKIRADPNYRRIDDKNNETIKVTTTESPAEIPDEDAEEPVANVQNSRGSGVLTTGQNFQIFDINDYLPKIKNYNFRTSIDTTKYKTIERRKETAEVVEENRPESSEISTTTTIKPTTTTTMVRRFRNRPKILTTTTTERTGSTTVVGEEKPKRVYPRRRVARIRTTTTEENPTKIVHRRHQPETTTPTPTTTTANENVTTFKDYDKTKRHGGNYRRQDDFDEKLTDVVPKPIMFYTDPTLPNNINRLVEINAKTPIVDLTDNEYDDDGEIVDEIEDEDGDENTKTSTNTTAFIKDPSQRLYYYAPI